MQLFTWSLITMGSWNSFSVMSSIAKAVKYRLYEPKCETRLDQTCAPIDPKYPTRWYMPCSPVAGKGLEIMQHIRFKLPNHLTCDHCVLQWYWAAGNVCNPPGFAEFFKGPRGPKWNNCPGQAEARGGYARRFKTCGGKKFAEEYYSCSDIAILPKKNKGQTAKKQQSTKKPLKKQPSKKQSKRNAYKSKLSPNRPAYKSKSSPKHETKVSNNSIRFYTRVVVGGKEVRKIRKYDAYKKKYIDIKAHHVGIISLNTLVESKNVKEVIYKIKHIGWKFQRASPYRYIFEKSTIAKKLRHHISVAVETADGRKNSLEFWIRFI